MFASDNFFVVVVLLLTLRVAVSATDAPVVSTDYGDVRGFAAMDRLNRTYDGFLGIPFAKPPVGPLRWQPSELPEPYDDVINATEFSVHCIQVISKVYQLAGFGGNDSEDCLYLNVYVPVSVEYALANPLPVMVWYYGGGFAIGTTEMYPGEELATTAEVIVVSCNYRVSTMGFFSTGDDVAPGNYGLWDAKTSLEWINANIAYFGGDPSRITIFGQSAGAFLVSHLMLSPQTNTMFDRVIAISGAARYQDEFTIAPTYEYLAGLFNCTTDDTRAMVDCLMEYDGKEIDRRFQLGRLDSDQYVELTTVIDGTFIVQDPRESLKQGVGADIDLMNGYTYHDSAGFVISNVLSLPLNRSNDGNKDNAELYEYLLNDFRLYDNVDEILEAAYERFPGMNDSDPAVASEGVTRFKTDFDFASQAFYQVERHAEAQGAGSTYFYEFRYRPSFLDGYPAWVNGSHIDDIYSILGPPFFKVFRETWLEESEYSPEDSLVSEIIMKYYGNFAYTGNPSSGPHTVPVTWPEYTVEARELLVETPTPAVVPLTEEVIDHYNWLLYDFWGLMRPGWGTPLEFGMDSLPVAILDLIFEDW